MKKYAIVLTLALFAGLMFVSSCGDSKAEEEARLKAIQDSLYQDSLAQAQALEDSLRQAYEDSVAMAMDSMANALDAAKSSGGSGGSSSKPKAEPQPDIKNMTVETGGTSSGGMKPKVEPTNTSGGLKGSGGTKPSGGLKGSGDSGSGGSGGGIKSGGLKKKTVGG